MDSQISSHDVSNLPENALIKDVITSETHHDASNQPAKKQTRQWAAWTRQEQESFFNALRQFGKNFEKITLRVQTKNKDQVRHYYYRLVRRMNKLLGPQLSLDAKNSKDTNAAMLRWWSLLEKHSCKASKLHLKPRRFKIFLETLEHQLLKDRKKNTIKQTRQRRKSAAYKKWEKAAIAGVSLVADAAAHLEQTTFVTENSKQTKLKLQLFPINKSIRKALETDNHNPHLELTLSFRKKISSVLQHMNRKWGNCSIASGDLTLVPYDTRNLNQKWTRASVVTAGDVYIEVGSPSVFRLRYGWFAGPENSPPCGAHKNGVTSVFEWVDSLTNVSISDLLADCSVHAVPPGGQCVPFSCDSFDAAIAAHINKNRGNNGVEKSSVLDAEETCDAFTFFKKSHTAVEKKDCRSGPSGGNRKDVDALTDVYWPDSLGGLEVEVGPCRYQSNELLLSESLGGLSRILSGSLDAFQNRSFFGLDQREPFPW
ncbi:hypothetical protein L1887_09579 [Cichorium endivia]|nr:hypothetical protein L1887_09579 [Cichorium endivia]